MKICDVTKSFGNRVLIEDATWEWNRSGLVVLLGRSGSGKSTLLNILGKIDSCDSGRISYGSGAEESEEDLRRNYVTYIFQEFNLLERKTVNENLETALEIAGLPWDEERVTRLLRELELEELRERSVSVLSGGEKQRVAIARAVLKGSKVILADEPTGNLDEENAIRCFDILKRISSDSLVLVVTHDTDLAQQYGDAIFRIEDKRLVLMQDKGYSEHSLLEEYSCDTEKKDSKWTFSYSVKRFREQIGKKVNVVAVLSLVLLSLAMVLGIYSATKHLVNEVNTSFLENDYYTARYNEELDGDKVQALEKASEYLKGCENVAQLLPYKEQVVFFSLDANRENGVIATVIRGNDFFAERYKDLVGRFPEKANEVLVNESFLKAFMNGISSEEAVGKEIVGRVAGEDRVFVVAGVRTREEVSESSERLYILEELQQQLQEETYRDLWISLHGTSTEYEIKKYDGEALVAGVEPTDAHEIVVDMGTYVWVYVTANALAGKYFTEEEVQSLPEEERIACLLDTWLSYDTEILGLDGKLRIVGVTATTELPTIRVTETLAQECARGLDVVDLYVKDISDESIQPLELELEKFGVILEPNGLMATKYLGSRFTSFLFIMAIVTCILIGITVLLSSFMAKNSVNESYYEIGVLKALGTSNKEVWKILLYDNLFVSAVSAAVCAILLLLLMCTGALEFLGSGGVDAYVYEWWHLPFVVAIGVLVNLVAGIQSIKKASSVKIIDSVRKKTF